MSAAAPSNAYGSPPRREAPWQEGPPWSGPGGWTPWNVPKPVLIAAMVLGFILFWPIGLAVLAFMIGSGRIGRRWARRWGMEPGAGPQRGYERGWSGWCHESRAAPSGNSAFDEYRVETLRRLEQEQQDFAAFLERLRFAKDKSEFDQFMSDRRTRPPAPPADDQPRG